MKKISYCILLVILCLSCTNDKIEFNELEKNEAKNINFIEKLSEQNLEMLAKEKLLFFIDNVSAKTKADNSIKIKNTTKIDFITENKDATTRTLVEDTISVFKYDLQSNEGEGYGLVAKDPRVSAILAYCPIGNLNDTVDNKALADYYNNIPQTILSSIQTYEKIKSRIITPGDYTWSTIWDKEGIMVKPGDGFTRRVEPLEDYWVNDTLFHGLYTDVYYSTNYFTDYRVPVIWDQGAPYNNNMPIKCANGNKAPAGCVAIAMAQIMAYHKHPSSYNWELLTSSPKISAYDPNDAARRVEVAKLIQDIGNKVKMEYECTSSGSNIYYANDAFKSFGYKTDGITDYNSSIAYHISNYGPTYIRGTNAYNNEEGHAWVGDGVYSYYAAALATFSKIVNGVVIGEHYLPQIITLFYPLQSIHINWGWNGSSNGWFVDAFDREGYGHTYRINVQKIANIRPK